MREEETETCNFTFEGLEPEQPFRLARCSAAPACGEIVGTPASI
jgi:hypothetical protein